MQTMDYAIELFSSTKSNHNTAVFGSVSITIVPFHSLALILRVKVPMTNAKCWGALN